MQQLAIDDSGCESAGHTGGSSVSGEAQAHAGLSPIQVADGDGKFYVATSLSQDEYKRVSVDFVPGALRICSGVLSRLVALPLDALVDQAVVHKSDNALTVSIPVKERRRSRHIIYVW